MGDRTRIQQLMPLMREFGSLERQRLGAGVTPLEYQRWLDLKGRIGQAFARSREAGLAAMGPGAARERPTRLLVGYWNRKELIEALVDNVQPIGLFVPTPFAARTGTSFLLQLSLEVEGERAELPAKVVTSITQGAHTLSTMSMGMALKLLEPSRTQAAAVAALFDGALDGKLDLDA